MRIIKNRKERELERIEARLDKTLQPVQPRAEFVAELGEELEQDLARKKKVKQVKKGILVAGGILGGVVMAATLIRSLTSWDELGETLTGVWNRFRKEQQTASA